MDSQIWTDVYTSEFTFYFTSLDINWTGQDIWLEMRNFSLTFFQAGKKGNFIIEHLIFPYRQRTKNKILNSNSIQFNPKKVIDYWFEYKHHYVLAAYDCQQSWSYILEVNNDSQKRYLWKLIILKQSKTNHGTLTVLVLNKYSPTLGKTEINATKTTKMNTCKNSKWYQKIVASKLKEHVTISEHVSQVHIIHFSKS